MASAMSPLPLPASLVAEISEAVDAARDDLVALTQSLIRIPSENPKLTGVFDGGEAAMQDRLAAALAPLDAEVSRWDVLPGRPNLVALVFGTGGGPSLALNGHVDTVPAGDASLWRYPPFAGTIAEGAICGRGACDMKGGLAAMVTAANVVRRLGPLRGNVQLQCVTDGAMDGAGTRATIKHGYRPEFALVVAPSDLVIAPPAVAPDQPGVVTLAECLRAAGREPAIAGSRGVGATAWYAEVGIPAVFCGPGKIEHAHGVDERLAIADLIQSAKVMALMMVAWCGLA